MKLLTALGLVFLCNVAQAYFTPSSLLSYLGSIAGQHTISGQFIEFGPLDPIEAIYNNTGKWLGMIGGDYWWYGETDFTGSTSFNQYATPYWKSGGIITISTSMPNPTTGGPLYDVSNLNVGDLLSSGTDTNNNLLAILDTVAGGISELQNDGVVVMYRPYHEMNGNWFWWGTSFLSDQQFIQLWQFTHDYLTNTKGLNNILWVYGTAGIGSITGRYAGDSYVDIVGQDLYSSTPTDGQIFYNSLASLGKTIAMCEFGSSGPNGGGDTSFNETHLIVAIQSTMPNTVFWQQWWDGNGNLPGWGMGEMQDVQQALSDPWVLNRDDLAKVNN